MRLSVIKTSGGIDFHNKKIVPNMGGGLKGNGQPHQQQHRASLVRPSVSAAVAGAAAASGSNSTLRRDRNSQQQQQSSAAHFSSSSSSLQLQRPLAPLAFEESESEDDANIMFNGGRVGMHRQQRYVLQMCFKRFHSNSLSPKDRQYLSSRSNKQDCPI